MAGLFGCRRIELRAPAQAADLLKRASEAEWVACELHRAGIGQKLTLTTHGALDQFAEKDPDPADDH